MKFVNNSEEEYRIVQAALAILRSKELESIVQYCKKQESCDTCVFNESGCLTGVKYDVCSVLNLAFFTNKYTTGEQGWIDECDAWLRKVVPKLRKKHRSVAKQNPVKRTLSSIFKRHERRR